jgi:hypothetical protein
MLTVRLTPLACRPVCVAACNISPWEPETSSSSSAAGDTRIRSCDLFHYRIKSRLWIIFTFGRKYCTGGSARSKASTYTGQHNTEIRVQRPMLWAEFKLRTAVSKRRRRTIFTAQPLWFSSSSILPHRLKLPRYTPWRRLGERRCSFYSFLTSH